MLITLARKPLVGSVAQNALQLGCGALNIDGTRISTTDTLNIGSNNRSNRAVNYGMTNDKQAQKQHAAGRWPANLLHDGSESVMGGFPQTKSGTHSEEEASRKAKGMFAGGIATDDNWYGDGSSAARFFKQLQRQPDGLPSQDKQVGGVDGQA